LFFQNIVYNMMYFVVFWHGIFIFIFIFKLGVVGKFINLTK
jgi:hypothetical protein